MSPPSDHAAKIVVELVEARKRFYETSMPKACKGPIGSTNVHESWLRITLKQSM